jgi:hypothetical protein
MRRATPEQIIAHVDLMRALDQLLSLARIVTEKREWYERVLEQAANTEQPVATPSTSSRQPAGVSRD